MDKFRFTEDERLVVLQIIQSHSGMLNKQMLDRIETIISSRADGDGSIKPTPSIPSHYGNSVAGDSSLPAPTRADGWVKVEDGLPDNGYYIVWCKSPDEYGLIHYHNNTGWGNGFYNDRVTHYQIPQPPKTAQQ